MNKIRERRLKELKESDLASELAKTRADLDYISMIAGIEVPVVEVEEAEGGMPDGYESEI